MLSQLNFIIALSHGILYSLDMITLSSPPSGLSENGMKIAFKLSNCLMHEYLAHAASMMHDRCCIRAGC